MDLYKISIKPRTSFCSPLQSDTFFGAFCWSYLYRYGEDALQELIDHYKKGDPDIVFSNAFPSGRLPMPLGITQLKGKQDKTLSRQERYHAYINNKKKEHLLNISLDDFNRVINGIIEITSDNEDTEFKALLWRNMVNRESDTAGNIEGEGSLFETEEIYSEQAYDVYIYSTLEKDVLDPTLREMFRYGIGAQRSVGKGSFDISGGLEIFDGFHVPEKPNGFVALSNFIPQKGDPTKGYYKTFVKYPKVSYISSDDDSPFKKPLIFLEAGSVFFDQPIRAYYGSCMEKVALKGGSVSDQIVIGAYTVAVPCYVEC